MVKSVFREFYKLEMDKIWFVCFYVKMCRFKVMLFLNKIFVLGNFWDCDFMVNIKW